MLLLFYIKVSPLQILFQQIKHGNNMANCSPEHKNMKNGMHIFTLIKAVKHCACDVTYALSHYPPNHNGANTFA